MKHTNYCAEYIQDNKSIPERKPFVDFANECVKFRLPDYGVIMSVGDIESKGAAGFADIPATFSKYITLMKLPYERVALEFSYSGNKMIVMAANHTDGTIRFTYSFKAMKNGMSCWFDTRVGVKISPTFGIYTGEKKENPLTNNENHLICYITYVVLGFITALACSNVIESDQKAELKLNKSRTKKGKQPFFNYKILTIDTQKHRNDKKGGASSTHNSPRAHLRRGHIRRLEDRNVWVNPCVVGDKTKGVIDKEYKVI